MLIRPATQHNHAPERRHLPAWGEPESKPITRTSAWDQRGAQGAKPSTRNARSYPERTGRTELGHTALRIAGTMAPWHQRAHASRQILKHAPPSTHDPLELWALRGSRHRPHVPEAAPPEPRGAERVLGSRSSRTRTSTSGAPTIPIRPQSVPRRTPLLSAPEGSMRRWHAFPHFGYAHTSRLRFSEIRPVSHRQALIPSRPVKLAPWQDVCLGCA